VHELVLNKINITTCTVRKKSVDVVLKFCACVTFDFSLLLSVFGHATENCDDGETF